MEKTTNHYSRAQKRRIMREMKVNSLEDAEKILEASYKLDGMFDAAIQAGIKKARAELIESLHPDLMANAILQSLWQQHTKAGFGYKRLKCWLRDMLEIWDYMADPERYGLTTHQISMALIDECGFDSVKEIKEFDDWDIAEDKRREALYGAYVKKTDKLLDIREAVEAMRAGIMVRRSSWGGGCYLAKENGAYKYYGNCTGPCLYTFSEDDIIAEDWELVRDERGCL